MLDFSLQQEEVSDNSICGVQAISMTDCQGLIGTSTICHISRETSWYCTKAHCFATGSWYYCLAPSVSKTTKRIWLRVMYAYVSSFTEITSQKKMGRKKVYHFYCSIPNASQWPIGNQHVALCIYITYHNGLPYLDQSSSVLEVSRFCLYLSLTVIVTN